MPERMLRRADAALYAAKAAGRDRLANDLGVERSAPNGVEGALAV